MNDTDILLDTLGDVDDELIPDISDMDIREKGRIMGEKAIPFPSFVHSLIYLTDTY